MESEGRVAYMKRNAYKVLVRKLEGNSLEDAGIDWRIVLKYV
jgi:hypothetical protein